MFIGASSKGNIVPCTGSRATGLDPVMEYGIAIRAVGLCNFSRCTQKSQSFCVHLFAGSYHGPFHLIKKRELNSFSSFIT
jgi:hypothetical protein